MGYAHSREVGVVLYFAHRAPLIRNEQSARIDRMPTITSTIAESTNFVQNLNWATPTWDLFVAIFFVVAVLLYGLSMGKERIILNMVAIYVAIAVAGNLPLVRLWRAEITINQHVAVRVTLFLGLFVLLFFLLSHTALSRTLGRGREHSALLHVLIFSMLHVGLLLSTVLSFLPKEALRVFSAFTHVIFMSDAGRAFWLLAPLVAMVMLPGKGRSRQEE